MYILILVSYAFSYANGTGDLKWPIVTQQEYSSAATCEAAKTAVTQMAVRNISAVCKPK